MFERFTGEARQVVVLAQEEARRLNHNYIGTEHILLAFLKLPGDGTAVRALKGLGFTAAGLVDDIERIVGRGSEEPMGHIPFTPRAKKVLELSLREALQLKVNHVGAEHVLLGVLREGDGVGAKILTKGGRSALEIRTAVLSMVKRDASDGSGVRTPAVEQALAAAEQIAAGAPLGSHHLLEALMRQDDSMAGKALTALGVTTDALLAQIDAQPLAETSDMTAEQAAASAIRWEADEDSVRIVSTDPKTVELLRRLVEQAGGTLTGDGPLAGPFVGLHQAIQTAAGGIDSALNPVGDPEEAPLSLRERLRRRKRA